MCNNTREWRIAGFKSNTYELIKKGGEQISREILVKAYQEIKDGDNSGQALCWNQALEETQVIEKKSVPSDVGEPHDPSSTTIGQHDAM